MPTLSLEDLQRRIADRDTELQRLRQQLEARNSQLTSLTQRKEALQTQLQQIEAEMAAAAAGHKRFQTAAPKPVQQKPAAKPSPAGKAARPPLVSLIVSAIEEAGQPLTVKELIRQVKQRGFKSKSVHFRKMVETRIYDLRKRGILQRAADQPGFVLAKTSNGQAAKATQAKPTMKGRAQKSPARAGAGVRKQPSLREVLTRILSKSSKPMPGGELAEQALKAGYKTTSKRLADSVWVALGNMKNVENVRGQGYRLKKPKTCRAVRSALPPQMVNGRGNRWLPAPQSGFLCFSPSDQRTDPMSTAHRYPRRDPAEVQPGRRPAVKSAALSRKRILLPPRSTMSRFRMTASAGCCLRSARSEAQGSGESDRLTIRMPRGVLNDVHELE